MNDMSAKYVRYQNPSIRPSMAIDYIFFLLCLLLRTEKAASFPTKFNSLYKWGALYTLQSL